MILRRILAALAVLCALVVPAQAQSTKAQLNSQINATFPDNQVGVITPAGVRTITGNIVNAIMPTAPVGSGNIPSFSGTTGLLQDSGIPANSSVPAVARMWPAQNQSTTPTVPWNAVDPWGNAISCASTTTQCLQEFITATASNGWPARVYCQGTKFPSATEPVFINVSSPVTVNVNQDWSFEAHGCNLNGSLVTSSLLTINSSGNGRFIWDGKIVYTVTSPISTPGATMSCAVMINPTTNTADGFPGLYAGFTWITAAVSVGSGGTAGGTICINTATGSTIQHELKFGEINGANSTAYGIIAFGPSATTGLIDNLITATQVHGTTVAAVQDGTVATNQGNLRDNIWTIGSIQTFSGIGLETYGSYSNFTIGDINGAQGTMATGISVKAGAVRPNFIYGTIGTATTATITDGGTCSSYQGAQGSQIALEGTTSGCTTIKSAAAASGAIMFPAGTTDFSATGGTSRFVKQASAGAAFTVVQPSCGDLSNSGTACQANTGTSGANVPLLNGTNTYSGTSTYSAQIVSTFGTPTIASGACGTGTNGTLSGTATNQSGIITIGAAATTTCTVSFSTTITAPNACVIFPGNATAAAQGTTVARVGTPSTTNWVITGSVLASTVYSYICL